MNTKVISANEYEAHHAFDLLYNNTSDIDPKNSGHRHSWRQ
nr:Tn3 family transposase [Vibrio parahaemolyticus]